MKPESARGRKQLLHKSVISFVAGPSFATCILSHACPRTQEHCDCPNRQLPLWVSSRQFSLISTNGSFRALSGHLTRLNVRSHEKRTLDQAAIDKIERQLTATSGRTLLRDNLVSGRGTKKN